MELPSFVKAAADPTLIPGIYDASRLDRMRAHLRRLRHEVEGRFSSARGFVRPGLDASN